MVRSETLSRQTPPPAYAYLAQAVLWNIALFAAIRVSWVDRHVIGALVDFQTSLIYWYGTTPRADIFVNSSCSGADVMALCAAVTLAYPVAWSRRLAGAALGLTLILTLNAVRIASLHAVAADPSRLQFFHLYLWPALLTIATLLYVVCWIRWGARRGEAARGRWTRFVLVASGALLVYAAVTPWVLTSRAVYEAGVWAASAGGAILGALGAGVRTSGNVLVTDRGAFQVTQECLFTPMVPLYLAAVCSLPMSGRRRTGWLLLALPLFFVLGVVRLLVLALPPQVAASPVLLAHGFYQFLAAAVLIIGAAHVALRRETGVRASQRTALALALALAAGVAAARIWEPVLLQLAEWFQRLAPSTLTTLATPGDVQGALQLLPAFQIGLLAGLWYALTAGRRARQFAGVLAGLGSVQVLILAALGATAASIGEPHPLVIRALALGVPLALAFLWLPVSGTVLGDRSYARFWHDVGTEFPSLTGAASTRYYFENETRLLSEALPSLAGCALLKTDLWDEAKNTRIMQWAADQGARVYGIDLSEPIVRAARENFGARTLRPVVSDVRRLPFGDASFDAIYSMGTIEHFAETEASVHELARLLKPGGRLVLGVPNRHDPFLRPLLVAILHPLGLYAYGYEKSYSRRALRRMIEAAGLEVRMESGILFMPGWVRMLDLWCHTRARPLTRLTGALVWPFAWLDRRVPALRRHGYLLASVGEKPLRAVDTGTEFVVDARGCDPEALRSLPRLQRLFAVVLDDLSLRAVSPPAWHVFPGAGGITGMVLLSESHLTIHTYPETRLAAINLYCCRSIGEWPWEARLRALLGATEVTVRVLRRGE